MDLLCGAKEEGPFGLQLFATLAGILDEGLTPTGTLCELAGVSTVARISPGLETPCTMGRSPSAPVSLGVRLLLRLQMVLCPQLKS